MIITKEQLQEFPHALQLEEKEQSTIDTYMTAVRQFAEYCGQRDLNKELVLRYKRLLLQQYAVSTVNSKLGAINIFLCHIGCGDLKVKRVRVQRQLFYPQERDLHYDEYVRLVRAAEEKGNQQLSLLLQTLCCTGIRVSELKFITVESAKKGRANVRNKGKSRVILFPQELCVRLLLFAQKKGMKKGSIFLTTGERPVERTAIWRRMQELCEQAKVSPEKAHPHALRHLFAVTYYRENHDPMSLADLLGHASLDTTRIYTATDGSEQTKQLERLHLLI